MLLQLELKPLSAEINIAACGDLEVSTKKTPFAHTQAHKTAADNHCSMSDGNAGCSLDPNAKL